jgi:hypothetical protein
MSIFSISCKGSERRAVRVVKEETKKSGGRKAALLT